MAHEGQQNEFKTLLEDAGIVSSQHGVKGSLVYLPYGWTIRNRIFDIAKSVADKAGYSEIHLPDTVDEKDLIRLDKLTNISERYLRIDDERSVAASHEVILYPFLARYLKGRPHDLPIRWYHFGNVFREPRSGPYPFSYGERSSFFECYGVFGDQQGATDEFEQAIRWNREVVTHILGLPSIEVERPLETNKPVSRKTVCIDTILPNGRTVITGMSYFHDDIFTRLFNVKYRDLNEKNALARSVHFGVSDNLLFSYLSSHRDTHGLTLSSDIAPVQVAIVHRDGNEQNELARLITDKLSDDGIRCDSFAADGSRQFASTIKRHTVNGTPLQVIIPEEGAPKVYSRYDNTITEIDRPSNFPFWDALVRNDEFLKRKMDKEKERAIMECDDMAEVNKALADGLIARTIIDPHTFDVRAFEKGIVRGEVLGTHNDGLDTVAYVSRRI